MGAESTDHPQEPAEDSCTWVWDLRSVVDIFQSFQTSVSPLQRGTPMVLAWETNEVIAPGGICEQRCQGSTEGVYLAHTGLFPLTRVGWQFFLEKCLVPSSLSAGVFLLSERSTQSHPYTPLPHSQGHHITPALPHLHDGQGQGLFKHRSGSLDREGWFF